VRLPFCEGWVSGKRVVVVVVVVVVVGVVVVVMIAGC
jgi:hypothetical protein